MYTGSGATRTRAHKIVSVAEDVGNDGTRVDRCDAALNPAEDAQGSGGEVVHCVAGERHEPVNRQHY